MIFRGNDLILFGVMVKYLCVICYSITLFKTILFLHDFTRINILRFIFCSSTILNYEQIHSSKLNENKRTGSLPIVCVNYTIRFIAVVLGSHGLFKSQVTSIYISLFSLKSDHCTKFLPSL